MTEPPVTSTPVTRPIAGPLDPDFALLLQRAQAGDPAAFAALYRANQPMLLRYLRLVAGDGAEDVASETWLRAIRGLSTFSGEEPALRGWLVRIARNVVADGHRRRFRRPELLTGDVSAFDGPAAADAADVALERIGTEQALRLVARLPADVAEMVMLRVVLELPATDVAELVGRSPGAVRIAVLRGLRRLAELVGDPGAAEEPGRDPRGRPEPARRVTRRGKAAFSGRDV